MKPGTAHGTVQRLRGEGPPKPGSGRKGGSTKSGDIHYRFVLDVPQELTSEQRKAVERPVEGDERRPPRAAV